MLALSMKTQIVIIGAGPSGLLLSQILHRHGIECVVLERQTRAHVEGRIRAGILEQITVDMLELAGAAERMHREGLVHNGFNILVDGEGFRIDMRELTGGSVMVYGQTELTKDLIDRNIETVDNIQWESQQVTLCELETDTPRVVYTKHGRDHRIECDYIAGCDGFHGICRTYVPAERVRLFERKYPFGWLGILADVPPCNEELIYCNHERGFALASMRSRSRSRYYIQCPLNENLEDWPDDRIWDELAARLGHSAASAMTRGRSIEKSIAPLRSVVVEPMQYGRLFLVGDAAHIVPPTGAKGLNLAASDVSCLTKALTCFYERGDADGLVSYSRRALARVWNAERFSWWFTSLTHRFPDTDPFARKMQIAEMAYIQRSRAAQTSIAENYAGFSTEATSTVDGIDGPISQRRPVVGASEAP
jgi:p-hydroxybenzoate 3-monooxygenase